MTTTRRIFAAGALAVLAAACARPAPFEPTGPGSEVRPLRISPENVVIDVSGLTDAEAVGQALEFYRGELAIDEPGGRDVRAVVNVHDFDVVDSIVSSLTGVHTALEGEVALQDPATGQTIYVTERIRVDSRSVSYTEDSGVIIRDRAETKAEKLSRLFMTRARQTLLSPSS